MVRVIVFILLLALAYPVQAQRKKLKQKPVTFKKHYNEILPAEPQYKLGGWILAPGATYMMTTFVPISHTYSIDDTEIKARATALGRPGIYAEVGRYRMLRYSKLVKYIDYGVSYKSLRGSERSSIADESLAAAAAAGLSSTASGIFGNHYFEAFFNANHVWRVGKYNFIQQSLGVNAGYAFITNLQGLTVAAATAQVPGNWSTQIHYKIGYGIKMRGNWLLIPTLETPILNILPFEPPRSSYGFFGSRYRPVIFSLRFLFMRPTNTMDCTPVRTREGMKMPTDMDKQRQMEETK